MKQTLSYTELINILEAARMTYKNWYKMFRQTDAGDMIELIQDLKYKLYESKANYFKITDDNPF